MSRATPARHTRDRLYTQTHTGCHGMSQAEGPPERFAGDESRELHVLFCCCYNILLFSPLLYIDHFDPPSLCYKEGQGEVW